MAVHTLSQHLSLNVKLMAGVAKYEWEMLILPVEVVETIVAHLTAKALAACCGVSVGWRELFNRDMFWKRFCDKRLAEYLSTTSSHVTPRFVIPQNSDSDLSPLCDWRISYMREAHLYANLREGRCIIEDLNSQLLNSLNTECKFFKDDFLLISSSKIEMFDLRATPVVYVTNPFEMLPNWPVDFCQIFDDRIVVVQYFMVRVYQINFMLQNWPQERIFLYNQETECTLEEGINFLRVNWDRTYFTRRPICCKIIGNIFVGNDQDNRSFHIWDLKIGKKIKEEVLKVALGSRLIDIKSSTTCGTEIVIVVLDQKMANGECFLFLVYSLQSFEFYPLAKSYKRYSQFLLFGDYLAIVSFNNLEILNYKTCQMIRELSSHSMTVDVWNNSIVFNQGKKLRRFLSSAEEVTLLEFDGEIVHFKFFNDKFSVVSVTDNNEWNLEEGMCCSHRATKRTYWKIGNDWRKMKQTPFDLEHMVCENEPCTKLLVNKNKWVLINYW